jgi:thiamine-monophosphate kinase
MDRKRRQNMGNVGITLDEEYFLRRIRRSAGAIKSQGLSLGIGDDAAVWKPRAGWETLLTCDWFLEGVHFLRSKHPADAVGWKCLARALSDVAAMGGEPRCFLLSLALPSTCAGRWLDGFLEGLRRASRRFGCVLAGGDTTRHEEILVNVTVVAEIKPRHAVLRTGARPGDAVFVSGRLGEAEAGLRLLRRSRGPANMNDPRLQKHLYPEPRLGLGRWLAENRLASAMMDVSDGVSTDLARLCAASGVGARIDAAQLPAVRGSQGLLPRAADALELALHGGDDYELLFTVPRGRAGRIPKTHRGLLLTKIGEITSARKVLLIAADGSARPLRPGGWDPFARRRS